MTSPLNNTVYSEEDRGLMEALEAGLGHSVPHEPETVEEITNRYRSCIMQPEMPSNAQGDLYCPRIFDGWRCWNFTEAGQVANASCPEFIAGFDPRRQALRTCMPSGEWYRHPAMPNSSGWSNYTTCFDVQTIVPDDDHPYAGDPIRAEMLLSQESSTDLGNVEQLQHITYTSGYAISLTALILSLIIFAVFRTGLNSTRLRIHVNLFVSFIVNNSIAIVWYQAIVGDVRLLNENPTWCQAIHILLLYFMVANYCWMFCESLYLNTLLMVAFVTEQKLMKWLYVIGWLVPAVFMLIYGLVRGTFPTETTTCWMQESKYTWLLSAPVCVFMIINFVLVVRIAWIMYRKLRAVSANEDHNNAWWTVRAVLILIPLLGLNYMMLPFRPDPGASGEDIYQIMYAIATSLQGFWVALLFCFTNGEVIERFKKRCKSPTPNSCATTTPRAAERRGDNRDQTVDSA